MGKYFNVTAECRPEEHYMVKLDGRLAEIRKMIDKGNYFVINRGRQYGKTTLLRALNRYLRPDYYVISMDFQKFDDSKFENGNIFSVSFADSFLRLLKFNKPVMNEELRQACETLKNHTKIRDHYFSLKELFEDISDICAAVDRPLVLLVDEVDQATNNQVFLDFLAQLRAYYIDRDLCPTFQSVILAGVHDIKNLRKKIRTDEMHRVNSPWNIATDFNINMSFSEYEIADMLSEYENDYHTGMDIKEIAKLLFNYTSGYPVLVSKLCKLMDEDVCAKEGFANKSKAWTKCGFQEAVKMILLEKNPLFESLIGKLKNNAELHAIIENLLFSGKTVAYNTDNEIIDSAAMFGFIKNQKGMVVIANRLFETRLYNYYLSEEKMRNKEITDASLKNKNQFIVGGHLNVKLILEKFVEHFRDLYGDTGEKFVEEIGRKYFLLYLRPIINGTGNYYIEAQTRGMKRTDVIIDYNGEQYIIEMKIWHGNEYHTRGEKQLMEYLEYYHLDKGYMLSFNFNKKKQVGIQEIVLGDKVLVEAVV